MRLPRRRRPVALRDHARLRPPASHREIADVGVSGSGDAVVLWTDQAGLEAIGAWEGDPAWEARSDAFWRDRPTHLQPRRPTAVTVTHQGVELRHVMEIDEVDLLVPVVQATPDGGALVVSTVCLWTESGPEQNARVYAADGALTAVGCLGDGIEHVRTTGSGQVYVGYSDTGINGNHGWSGPGPVPIGASGLVRFSAGLDVEWEFAPRVSVLIDDCEALTLVGDDAWAYCYSDYFLTRVAGDTADVWSNRAPRRLSIRRYTADRVVDAAGVQTLAVEADLVCIAGGYRQGGAHADLELARVGEALEPLSSLRLTMPDGADLPPHARMVGQDADLNVFVGSRWLKVDVSQLPR